MSREQAPTAGLAGGAAALAGGLAPEVAAVVLTRGVLALGDGGCGARLARARAGAAGGARRAAAGGGGASRTGGAARGRGCGLALLHVLAVAVALAAGVLDPEGEVCGWSA